MSPITFSGLATGRDTDSIIESLMELDRTPIDALEGIREDLEAQNETFVSFNSIPSAQYGTSGALDLKSELNAFSALIVDDAHVNVSAYHKILNLPATRDGNVTYCGPALSGFEADYLTGKISCDSNPFKDALETSFNNLQTVSVGDDDNPGAAVQISLYLDGLTNGSEGLDAAKIENNESNFDRLIRRAENPGRTDKQPGGVSRILLYG